MNEEANFCSQCGATVTLGAKFCSNCGYDLQNSSTQTPLDKTIKVEVTNATVEKGFEKVEKGFKAVEKGVKATGKGLEKGVKATGKGAKQTIKIIVDNCNIWDSIIVLLIGFLLLVVGLAK
jgi:hypothetical protein